MRFPVIERLMVRGSQVAPKHVIHDMVTRTLVMELSRRAIKRWVPCGDMDRRLKIPHSAKVECGFRTTHTLFWDIAGCCPVYVNNVHPPIIQRAGHVRYGQWRTPTRNTERRTYEMGAEGMWRFLETSLGKAVWRTVSSPVTLDVGKKDNKEIPRFGYLQKRSQILAT